MNYFKLISLRITVLACLFIGLFPFSHAQTTVCQGDSVYLSLPSVRGAIQWESSTDGITYTAIPGGTSITLGDDPSANTWYRAIVTEGSCAPIISDTTEVLMADVMADAGPDTAVCGGFSVMLGGNPTGSGGTGPYLYDWNPATGLNNPNVANPSCTPTATTTYTLSVIDANGCVGTDMVTVDTSGTAPSDSVVFQYSGAIAYWTVPPCVFDVTISVWGAQGGDSNGNAGGRGAYIKGDFSVNPGEVYAVLVGEKGGDGALQGTAANDATKRGGGGGGGSFFVFDSTITPLIVAGGGGGFTGTGATTTMDGRTLTSGGDTYQGGGGTAGFGGGNGGTNGPAAGGGGFLGDGGDSGNSIGGKAYLNGGAGGSNDLGSQYPGGLGGFGGGGSGWHNNYNRSGGGGGYSGGQGGTWSGQMSGGGGGSYNGGINQTNAGGIKSGNGRIVVSW